MFAPPKALLNRVEQAGQGKAVFELERPDPDWSRSNIFSDAQRPCSVWQLL